MLCQMKQNDHLSKGCDEMAIPYVEEILCVSSYLLLYSMVFDTEISDEVAKMRAVTLLGEIIRLHQCTKNPLKYLHAYSKYGHIVAIPASDTQE